MSPARPQLRGTFGMTASTHWLASSSAMAVLDRGGNGSTPPRPLGSSCRSPSRT